MVLRKRLSPSMTKGTR